MLEEFFLKSSFMAQVTLVIKVTPFDGTALFPLMRYNIVHGTDLGKSVTRSSPSTLIGTIFLPAPNN